VGGADVSSLAGGEPVTAYWLMLLVPMLAGLSPWKAKGTLSNLQWFLYGALLIFIIGLRHKVGGDWDNYIGNFIGLEGVSFSEAITVQSVSHDFAYETIHWFSLNYLNGIYSTNLICAVIFVAGLLRVCKNMPFPWLALVISIPYLVIVVAMGYTRQGVAIGFIMWGLIDLINGKKIRFYIMVLLAVLFHKTSLFMLPIGFLYGNSIRNWKDMLLFTGLFVVAFIAFVADQLQNLLYQYVTNSELESSGAFIRVLMNVFAALNFLYFRKVWREKYDDAALWMIFSIASLIMLPLTFVSSTSIDRMALYFLPMQLVILSRIPVLITDRYNRTLFILGVLFLYIGALFVWLNFGSFSSSWIPYNNLLFN